MSFASKNLTKLSGNSSCFDMRYRRRVCRESAWSGRDRDNRKEKDKGFGWALKYIYISTQRPKDYGSIRFGWVDLMKTLYYYFFYFFFFNFYIIKPHGLETWVQS